MDQNLMRAYIEVSAATTRANVRAMALQSANIECNINRLPMKYHEEDFLKIIEEEGIGYNDIIGKLHY